jgi:signal transduction histidine kinase/DNA-binding response OmpR family regulator
MERGGSLGLVSRSLLFLTPLVGAALASGWLVRAETSHLERELLHLEAVYVRLLYTERFALRWVDANKESRELLLGDRRDAWQDQQAISARMRMELGELARLDPAGRQRRALLGALAEQSAETCDRLSALAESGRSDEANALLKEHEDAWEPRLQRALAESDEEFRDALARVDALSRSGPLQVAGLAGALTRTTPELWRTIETLRLVRRLLEEHSVYAELALSGQPADPGLREEAARRTDAALREWSRVEERQSVRSKLLSMLPDRLRAMRSGAQESLSVAAQGRRQEAGRILDRRVDALFDRDVAWEPLARSAWADARQGLGALYRSADLLHASGLGVLVLTGMLVVGPLYTLQGIVRPIGALREAVRRYGSEGPGVRVPQEGPPEIAALAAAFNEMAALVETRSLELEEAYEAAEEGSRVKGRFLAQMSHEVRTPMNGILGMTELLLREELAPGARELAEKAHRAGRLLLDLLNDILDFSKLEAGRVELESIAFDPRHLVGGVVDLFEKAAEDKGIGLHSDVAESVPRRVYADPGRLRQILLNLVGNALRFTDRGRVDVSATFSESREGRGRLRFEVRDTGIGIEPAAQAQLFQPFVQAEAAIGRRYGGTGLGLAIVKQLVGVMAGEIGLESRPGLGSRFWFAVPVVCARDAGQAAREGDGRGVGAAPRSSCAGARVLLAEDDPVNREVACAMLASLGCQVDVAENGSEARALFAERGHDLVLMDCQMPVEDGYEAAQGIRALEAAATARGEPARRTPIVAATAAIGGDERARCLAAGMDDQICKPFSRDDLAEALCRWLPESEGDEGLDERKLDEIRRLEAGGARDLLRRTLEAYLGSAPRLLDAIRQAGAEGDLESLSRAAHALKSSSRNIGAARVGALAEAIERAGRERRPEQAQARAAELESAWQKLRPQLAAKIGDGDG